LRARAWTGVLMSPWELLTALNLHKMTSGLSHFAAFGFGVRVAFGVILLGPSGKVLREGPAGTT
jgi:hypothetical protein